VGRATQAFTWTDREYSLTGYERGGGCDVTEGEGESFSKLSLPLTQGSEWL